MASGASCQIEAVAQGQVGIKILPFMLNNMLNEISPQRLLDVRPLTADDCCKGWANVISRVSAVKQLLHMSRSFLIAISGRVAAVYM